MMLNEDKFIVISFRLFTHEKGSRWNACAVLAAVNARERYKMSLGNREGNTFVLKPEDLPDEKTLDFTRDWRWDDGICTPESLYGVQ